MKDEIWKTRDGTEIEVKNMTDSHIRNALRLIIRKLDSGDLRFSTFEERTGCDATEADIY